jgi:hypothetical protein
VLTNFLREDNALTHAEQCSTLGENFVKAVVEAERQRQDLNGRCDEALQKAKLCNRVRIGTQLSTFKYSQEPLGASRLGLLASHWLISHCCSCMRFVTTEYVRS